MLKHAFIIFALFSLSFPRFALAADAAPTVIGTVVEIEGKGTITIQGKMYQAVRKSSVHMHDVIATGAKSKMLVLFADQTQITLSENAKLVVDEYVFNPKDNTDNAAEYSITEGAFKYVSGFIAKKPDPVVSIKTAYGSIGIRGTTIQCGRVKDTYGVMVDEGRVRVRNDGGEVYVNKGKATLIKSRREKPSPEGPPPEEFLKGLAFVLAFADPTGVMGLLGNAQQDMNPENFMKQFMQGGNPFKKGGSPLDNLKNKKKAGNPLDFIPKKGGFPF